jgi:hypothetical protein
MEPVAQMPAGGRARDQEIDDDLAALSADIERLPQDTAATLDVEGATARSEQLAAVLHYATALHRPEEVRGLAPLLRDLLADPGEARLALLHQALHADRATDTSSDRRLGLLLVLARYAPARVLHLLGPLSANDLAGCFPEILGPWLEGLDPGGAGELEVLDEVCARLGAPAFERHAAFLEEDLARRLSGTAAAALLRRPAVARLPVVRVLLAGHPEAPMEEAAVFLRALDPEPEEAFLLFQMPDATWLRREYLVRLTDLMLGRIGPELLRDEVCETLCLHIHRMGCQDPQHPTRLESIRNLARYPTARGWQMLRDLARAGFLGLGGSEPLAVRRLARTVARLCDAA